MVSDRIKNIIFKQFYKELSKVEIIPYQDSIYFIDRDNKYWYFEYEKSGKLWWRYDFFTNFFIFFSLEHKEYEKVMSEWVEEVLNCKVLTTNWWFRCSSTMVEEVLKLKVNTTGLSYQGTWDAVEEVLKLKVNTTCVSYTDGYLDVEKALNYKVDTTDYFYTTLLLGEEQVLKHKVSPTEEVVISDSPVEEALNCYVNNT